MFLLIPGIKETFFLDLFGQSKLVSDFTLKTLNLNNCLSTLIFLIGIVIGVILICKLISRFIINHKNKFYLVLRALLISAIVLAIFELEKFTFNFVGFLQCYH